MEYLAMKKMCWGLPIGHKEMYIVGAPWPGQLIVMLSLSVWIKYAFHKFHSGSSDYTLLKNEGGSCISTKSFPRFQNNAKFQCLQD